VILGLAAALGWGCSDLVAAIAARRMGSRATVVIAQVVGLAAFGVLWVLTTPAWHMPAHDVLLLIGSGCFAGVAYFALYRGLELGPVALVSPIASAFASVTVVLAIVLLGESPGVPRMIGVAVTIVGVILASTDLRAFEVEARRHKRGLPYALAAMAGFGVAAFATGSLAKDYGWLAPITVSRLGSLGFVLVVTRVAGARPRPDGEARRPSARDVALAAAAGVADVLGIAAYARGSELGLVSIVAAASATFTLIPVAGGIALFGERPAPNQAVGLACVIGGLLLLGA
jgi:drug/metabolite transporter (DMT)-like permease